MKLMPVLLVLVVIGGSVACADTAPLREILSHPVATMADAYRGVASLALAAEQNRELQQAGSFAAYRDALVAAGIVPAKWRCASDSPATKARLAYMVCRVAKIKGGLTIRLFGLSQRYALRECVYLKIVLPGAEYKPVSGREVLAILKRAEDYMRKRKIVLPEREAEL